VEGNALTPLLVQEGNEGWWVADGGATMAPRRWKSRRTAPRVLRYILSAGWRRPCTSGLRARGAIHRAIADPKGLRQPRLFCPWEMECRRMKDPVFERYDYKQQANSLKMRINWIVPAVSAHMRKGRLQRKAGVSAYPQKVIRQLRLIITKLQRLG
jgi:hypothetical protein